MCFYITVRYRCGHTAETNRKDRCPHIIELGLFLRRNNYDMTRALPRDQRVYSQLQRLHCAKLNGPDQNEVSVNAVQYVYPWR